MAVINFPNGLGSALGDGLVTASPLEVNGNVWYVNASTGTDAASPAGQNRLYPVATLSQAITNSADGDIIVCMDGHAETLTAALSIDQDLIIVGEGQSDGKPTVKFTNNSAAGSLFSFEGGANSSYVDMRNIWIEENAQSNSAARMVCSSLTYLFLDGLYVECNGNDTVQALTASASGTFRMVNCTFVSTTASGGTQPHSAVAYNSPAIMDIQGCVFDGGSIGFSKYFALWPNSGAPNVIWGEGVSLLRGADIKLTESSIGHFSAATSGGSARIDWCDVGDPA